VAGLVFTCRRCGIHGAATVVHEVNRAGRIRPVENQSGFQLIDRDEIEVDARRYFECGMCHAAEYDLPDLFTVTTGTAT
jgi:hypothetical protein